MKSMLGSYAMFAAMASMGNGAFYEDEQYRELTQMEREELKDQLISGRCFRHFRIGYDEYSPETWSPKNTFFSRG